MALGSRGATEILQAAKDLEHGGEPGFAEAYSEAFMRPKSEMCVCVHIAVEADLFGLFEGSRVLAGRNLNHIDISIFCASDGQIERVLLTKLHTISSPFLMVIFSPLSSTVVSFVASRGKATEDCSRAPSMKLRIISTST